MAKNGDGQTEHRLSQIKLIDERPIRNMLSLLEGLGSTDSVKSSTSSIATLLGVSSYKVADGETPYPVAGVVPLE